jgi:N-acetylglucosaminyl-diphospho-decaprenol L-rhamnosyltransferase
MTVPKIGAVVVDYGGETLLTDCVKSLVHSGIEEIVVVDNGTPDGKSSSGPYVKDFDVKTIVSPVNDGFGAGANLGSSTLESEMLIIANSDTVSNKNAVTQLARALSKDKKTAIAGPVLVDQTGNIYPSARIFPNVFQAAGHGILSIFWPNNRVSKSYKEPEIIFENNIGVIDWVSGAFFMIKKAVFEELNGFDPAYFMYLEDVDLCFRAKERGYQTIYVNNAQIIHITGYMAGQNKTAAVKNHHKSAYLFEKKHAKGTRRLLLPLAGIFLTLRAIFELARLKVLRKIQIATK